VPNSALTYETSVASTLPIGPRVSVTDASDMAKLLIRTKRMQVGQEASPPNGLPRQSHAERSGQVLVAGTRPAEWTVLSPRGTDVSGLVSDDATTVDLTHGRSGVRVSGVGAAELLSQLCSLDFADDFTPNGAVVSGSVSAVMCDIIRDDVDGERSYLLLLDRSFAHWFTEQLVDVAKYLNQHPLRGQ
jgi:heterotetrameric sarcosine oxidase gamma subunit